MKMKSVFLLLLISTVLVRGFNHTAQAEDKSSGSDWEFALAPFYLWAVSLDGDVVVGPQGNSVSMDFGDIFENLEAAFILRPFTKRIMGYYLTLTLSTWVVQLQPPNLK